ncbi:S-layer homology domain-containing protein [Gorillibacterium sp. sgz500922]|uniref:S-layer homology domain-containing protein n=1 Tax=Gorillibacterium sp. sgz500922 TaxID=3446694 RepID=UPI003F6665A9
MRSKGMAAGLLSAALFTTGALPAAAAGNVSENMAAKNAAMALAGAGDTAVKAKIGKEEALAKLKAAISIPAGYKLTAASFNGDSWISENGSWQFQFESGSGSQVYSYLFGTIDGATGRLIGYSLSDHDPDKQVVYPPKLDYAAAKEVAFGLLKKMNPGEAASTIYDGSNDESYVPPLQGEVSYSFRFDRSVDGVRYPTDNITFTIDGSGALTGYQFAWHPSAAFEASKPAIAAADALAAYKKAAKPFLQYVLTEGKKAKLALTYALDARPLDAATGKLVSWDRTDFAGFQPLAAKPLAAKPARGQKLTDEKAAEIARKTLSIPAAAVLEGITYNEQAAYDAAGAAQAVWRVTFRIGKAADSNAIRYSAAVNADTGEVLTYNYDSSKAWQPLTEAELPKVLDDAKLKKSVRDFVLKTLPHYADQLGFIETDVPDKLAAAANDSSVNTGRIADFSLRRVVDGAVTLDSLSVNVDRINGTVIHYSANLASVDYPSKTPAVIASTKAMDILLAPYRLELQYQDSPAADYSTPWKDRKPAKLVYMPTSQVYDSIYLDAVTGEWKKQETGEVTQPGRTVATDIAGHPAQKELQLLIDYKALDVKDGKVHPEQAVTRGELIKMLMTALQNGSFHTFYAAGRANSYKDVLATSSYFSYVEAAVDAGILDRSTDTLNPDAKMTREEMAGLLVRALGFDKLAGVSGLFKLDYRDADQVKLKGQVAIALALGLFNKAADGSFRPTAEVTRADAAVAFYKFLQIRPTMQSSPIRPLN